MARQRIDLALVKMCNGLDVGTPISIFHEEPLIVLEAIRRAYDGVVEPVSVEIFDSLADSLFEVGCRDDLQVFAQAQSLSPDLAAGRPHHEVEVVHATFQSACNHDLVLPRTFVIRENPPNGLIAPAIASDRLERGSNV